MNDGNCKGETEATLMMISLTDILFGDADSANNDEDDGVIKRMMTMLLTELIRRKKTFTGAYAAHAHELPFRIQF